MQIVIPSSVTVDLFTFMVLAGFAAVGANEVLWQIIKFFKKDKQ